MKTFSERVLEISLSIQSGEVSTYGDIARAAGAGGQAARSISGILGRYYKKGITEIPFHRIVYSNGRIWTQPDHAAARLQLFRDEGVQVDEKGYIIDFESRRRQF